ncbi:CPBP family intramembrane glutamic endopeptidase [Novosphingobium sp. ZN18A2]|uniref:CPBP family intramembrane glutamic endopeptidase n=1 Tax=Novosphingobium sp. ZN18A2 TaxID=3079861 RepID=UPI0030CDACF0
MGYDLLLAAIVAALGWSAWHNRGRMEKFRALTDTDERQRTFKRWTLSSFAIYGLGGAALLALIGRAGSLVSFPAEFRPVAALVGPGLAQDASQTGSMLAGMVTGVIIATMALFIVWRFVLGKRTQPVIGDVAALFPRNRAEAIALLPLAINAGLSEEIMFRVALPLLGTLATGSAVAGFAIAAVTFGLMHWYQGWRGVLLTGLASGVFISLYVSSGTLIVPIVIHALVDVMLLVVRPSISLWLDGRQAPPAAAQTR